jgi:hypothetical protein
MRYFLLLFTLLILISSCKKNSNYNLNRSEILGNYHFFYDSTTWYNGAITISNPDQGNGVNITYPNNITIASFTTTDSTLTSTQTGGPHYGAPVMGGNYRHDTIFITDYSNVYSNLQYGNGRIIYSIGVKY